MGFRGGGVGCVCIIGGGGGGAYVYWGGLLASAGHTGDNPSWDHEHPPI